MEELLHLEIQHMKDQIELLDAMWEEHQSKEHKSCCSSIKNLSNYYYENFLYKLGFGSRKEE